jgi:hypothetical protein
LKAYGGSGVTTSIDQYTGKLTALSADILGRFRSGSSGARVEINDAATLSGGYSAIDMYMSSGYAGSLLAASAAGVPALAISSPYSDSVVNSARLTLYAGNSDPWIGVNTRFHANGRISTNGAVDASGAVTSDGNIVGDKLRATNGLAVWGHSYPASQPATPTNQAGIIGVLQAYGLCA